MSVKSVISIVSALLVAQAAYGSGRKSSQPAGSAPKASEAKHVDTYTIDQTHANIGFTVKHLGISNVRGSFKGVSATVEYDGSDLSSLRLSADIKADSIDTDNKKRDDHLRGPDFFDITNHSGISFVTKSVHPHGESGHLVGTLTMKGVSKDVELTVSVNGPVDSPFEPGVKIVGLHVTGKLNRQDWGVAAPGGVDKLIGNQVSIELNLEAKK